MTTSKNNRTRVKMLSAEEEHMLLDRYLDNGDMMAREKLITSYLPMATKAAQIVARRGNVPLEDLCQEAAIALGEAIDKHDRTKGSRISTLARYYIRAALLNYVMGNNGIVRVGTNFSDKRIFMNLRRMVSDIEAKTGNPITDAGRQQIADQLGVKLAHIRRMEPRIYASDTHVSPTDSIDDEDGGMSLGNAGIIIQGEQGSVESDMDKGRVMSCVATIISRSYSGRDLEIIQCRLNPEYEKSSLDIMSKKHGITVERVRQIQRAGLETARSHLATQGIHSLSDVSI